MRIILEVRKSYKFKMYDNAKRNKTLHDAINIAGIIRNHAIALQRRYYRLTGKYIPLSAMKKHIAKLRMRTEKYSYWKVVGSQAVQNILEQLDDSYRRFFKKQGRLPRFRKVKKRKSITLKQAGWKLIDCDKPKRGIIRVMGKNYKFVKHRNIPAHADIKTVTIKRDAVGRLRVIFSVVEKVVKPEMVKISSVKIGGFDFGLKQFLTADNGAQIESPQFFQQNLSRMRQIQRCVSKKLVGSNNKRRGLRHIARRHIRIADKRRDFAFQLAHNLCDHYDIMVFEDLNLKAMQKLWGRKVSDLGFHQFTKILEYVAMKRGKRLVYIDRWERTTGKCSGCGHTQNLALSDRTFHCEACGLVLDRDHNASINILEAGRCLILHEFGKTSNLASTDVDDRSLRL